jgi:DNA modification methylase
VNAPYWQGDGITLYLGECLQLTEWLAADALVTDPPYGIGYSRPQRVHRGGYAHTGIDGDDTTAARDGALELWGVARPAVVFGSFLIPPPPCARQTLVYLKPPDAGHFGSVAGYRRDTEAVYLCGAWPAQPGVRSSLLRTTRGRNGGPSRGHPHSKPLDLLGELIDACPPGTVADPFAGSGSTLVAARNMGRPAIGVEIEERHCEIAARRLAQGVLL